MLQISDLTLRIAGRALLEGANLSLPNRAKVGLVGRNGTGKTTLFRAILGELAPESGAIALPKGWRIGAVAQEAPAGRNSLLDEVLTHDRERAALLAEAESAADPLRIAAVHARLSEIDSHSAEARAARVLAGLGFDSSAQAKHCADFSGGWRMRVALAGLLFSEPDLLLLDEPTNYLDLEGTLWLNQFLAKYPRSAILISHDRDLLNEAVGGIVHLQERKLTFYRGPYDQFERQYREKKVLTEKLRQKQDAERRHMEAFVERFRAKATKARQAQSRLKALAKLAPIAEIAEEGVTPIRFPSPQKRLSPPILRLEGVSVGYAPGNPILQRLDLRLDDDDRIALLGANGNGKSTFAKLIAGHLQPEEGVIGRSARLKVGFFAQHQLDHLRPDETPVQHMAALAPQMTSAEARARVAQMGLATEKMDTPAKSLSGGEKARLLMGLAAYDRPNLLILDEPTNHLDIDSRETLIRAINDYEGAVILISHDRHLIEASADRLWLVEDRTVKPFDGDIEDYRRLILEGRVGDASPRRADEAATTQRNLRREKAERREALAPLKKRIRAAEAEIDRRGDEIAVLDRQLADPALHADEPKRAVELATRRARAAEALAHAEEDWLRLSADYEAAEAAAA